ncbi:hypothetical protein A9Q84_15985 [Halobacteriovorax marinus]|uniref:ABC transporter substrate-binding protein n=1 Tax=Halobacteriovorax marinus TaxID=97084 RepID=A0A1Y5F443_9BACT|nr:hypothetical protein A9Q84_15985 [Halobacteriovorax marinus]
MKKVIRYLLFSILIFLVSSPHKVFAESFKKVKMFIVSSYHREYLWSQDTSKGLVDGLLKGKYLTNNIHVDELIKNDQVETKKIIIKKVWMDTKRRNSYVEIINSTEKIINQINNFKPDILLLGDDNAAKYIGDEFLDTKLPIVFWGVNGTPVKYGLLDSKEKPGHNVTGVYQAGYLKESMELFLRIVPNLKTIAVIADDSTTGRSKTRELKVLHKKGLLNIKIEKILNTDNYEEWKRNLLQLQDKVDGFIIFNHNSLKDKLGKPIDQMTAGKWYLKNIKRPECSHEAQFVQEGLLCATDDSGYKQGLNAIKIARLILEQGKKPASIPAYAPSRGKHMINTQRAEQLGITITKKMGIEKFIKTSKALQVP